MNYNNPIKDAARKKCVSSGKTYRRIIDLAGKQALSIEFLHKGEHIDSNCDITIVDHHKKNLEAGVRKIKAMGLAPKGHRGEIETCPTDGCYDWVNLDTCSSFSLELGQWLGQLKMSPNGEVNVWLTCYRANGQLLHSLEETFNTKRGRKIAGSLESNCLGDEELLGIVPREKRAEAWATLTALASCFSQSFDIVPIQVYIAGVNRMYVYRFVNFGKGQLQFPNLEEFFVEGTYEGWKGKETTKNTSPIGLDSAAHELVLHAVESPAHRPFCTKMLRQKLHEAKLNGNSNTTMIKAGWKSHLTKITEDDAVRMQCHTLVDNA